MDLAFYWYKSLETGLAWWDDASYIIAQGDPEAFWEGWEDSDLSPQEIIAQEMKRRSEARKAMIAREDEIRELNDAPF